LDGQIWALKADSLTSPVIGRKGSLRNSPISEETYQNQHVATYDDHL